MLEHVRIEILYNNMGFRKVLTGTISSAHVPRGTVHSFSSSSILYKGANFFEKYVSVNRIPPFMVTDQASTLVRAKLVMEEIISYVNEAPEET